MKEIGSYHVVDSVYNTFIFFVLRRCVWASETELSTCFNKELVERKVVKFSIIIALQGLKGFVKLCLNVGLKLVIHIKYL